MRVKLAGASTLGEAARIQARLKAITRQAAVLRRKAARRDKQQCLEELLEAQRRGRDSEAAALARRLAGAGRGARKRNYRAVPQSIPDQEELVRLLCGPASERGMEAYRSSWDEEVAAFSGYDGVVQQVTPELIESVDRLLQGMRWRARKAAKGRAVPPWAVPLEVLWMLFFPNWRVSSKGVGLGTSVDKLSNPATWRFLRGLLMCILRTCSPFRWHVSLVVALSAKRFVHLLDPFGKVFYGALLDARKEKSQVPPFAHGCYKGRRKETPMMVQMNLS